MAFRSCWMARGTDDRYVFDTNGIISALLFSNSKPAQAFLYVLDHGVVCVSLALLAELQRVLDRPKFERYAPREEREQFLAALVREAVLVDVTEQIHACRDPKDDMIL